MSLVVITIQDEDDDRVDIKLLAEPPFDLRDDGADPSGAQTIAMQMLQAATAGADDVQAKAS